MQRKSQEATASYRFEHTKGMTSLRQALCDIKLKSSDIVNDAHIADLRLKELSKCQKDIDDCLVDKFNQILNERSTVAKISSDIRSMRDEIDAKMSQLDNAPGGAAPRELVISSGVSRRGRSQTRAMSWDQFASRQRDLQVLSAMGHDTTREAQDLARERSSSCDRVSRT